MVQLSKLAHKTSGIKSIGMRFFCSSGGGGLKNGLIGLIGNTPLLQLASVSAETGCSIVAKAEFLNPGGSVKDRAALFMLEKSQKSLKPGATVVEGTAGNTGIGLAHVCNAKGFQCVIFMPNTQSQEKIDLLRVLGAQVFPVPVVPFTDPMNFNHQAKNYAQSMENAIWTNQFDNLANKLAHYETTGPEIWNQTNGQIDAFTCATGTGGTLAGVGQFLKEKNPEIKIILADPPGSVLFNFVKDGTVLRKGDGSITEGIGQGRITKNLENTEIDDAVYIEDHRSIEMTYRLLKEEGIFVGASSALNIVAACDVAKEMGPGHTIGTILCDGGGRYQSRLFSKSWLEEKGLLSAVPDKYASLISLS